MKDFENHIDMQKKLARTIAKREGIKTIAAVLLILCGLLFYYWLSSAIGFQVNPIVNWIGAFLMSILMLDGALLQLRVYKGWYGDIAIEVIELRRYADESNKYDKLH